MTFTFTLEIDGSQVTHRDVALALRRGAALLDKTPTRKFEDGDTQPIRDPAGERVGEWKVEETS